MAEETSTSSSESGTPDGAFTKKGAASVGEDTDAEAVADGEAEVSVDINAAFAAAKIAVNNALAACNDLNDYLKSAGFEAVESVGSDARKAFDKLKGMDVPGDDNPLEIISAAVEHAQDVANTAR